MPERIYEKLVLSFYAEGCPKMDARLANTWRLSVNEKKFIESALLSGIRVDGRNPYEFRKLSIKFGRQACTCNLMGFLFLDIDDSVLLYGQTLYVTEVTLASINLTLNVTNVELWVTI